MEAKGPVAPSDSHPPTHVRAAGTQTRDPGLQGVACTSCPNSGSRRKLSIERSYSRGRPHKQNNPVLGQQPAAGGRGPDELPDQQGCSVDMNMSSHCAHSSTKRGAPAVVLPKTGCPRSTKVECPGHGTAKRGCPGHGSDKVL